MGNKCCCENNKANISDIVSEGATEGPIKNFKHLHTKKESGVVNNMIANEGKYKISPRIIMY
jgi:hypothetical protein